jgi:hypothetical protein
MKLNTEFLRDWMKRLSKDWYGSLQSVGFEKRAKTNSPAAAGLFYLNPDAMQWSGCLM